MAQKTFDIKDSVETIEFNLGKDKYTFEAYSPEELPAFVLMEYSDLVGEGKVFEAHKKFFQNSLKPESAEEFTKRMNSHENTINLNTMIQVAEWLIEVYSARPKQ